jgi:hypothetical protein
MTLLETEPQTNSWIFPKLTKRWAASTINIALNTEVHYYLWYCKGCG